MPPQPKQKNILEQNILFHTNINNKNTPKIVCKAKHLTNGC